MLYFENWKIILICAICALGVLLSLPNLFSPSLLAQLPSWVPHKQVALGLDLRGGSYLLLEVDVGAAQHERLNTLVDNVRNALRDASSASAASLSPQTSAMKEMLMRQRA